MLEENFNDPVEEEQVRAQPQQLISDDEKGDGVGINKFTEITRCNFAKMIFISNPLISTTEELPNFRNEQHHNFKSISGCTN